MSLKSSHHIVQGAEIELEGVEGARKQSEEAANTAVPASDTASKHVNPTAFQPATGGDASAADLRYLHAMLTAHSADFVPDFNLIIERQKEAAV